MSCILRCRLSHIVSNTAAPAVLWADNAAESGSSEDGEFKRVTYKKLKSPSVHRVRLVGARPLSAGTQSGKQVRSVPRFTVAFVGRLQKDTTADDLKEYLSDIGIPDARCTLLSAKLRRSYL